MEKEKDIYQHFSQEGLKDPRHKKSYEMVFEALGKQPDFKLSGDFAKKVIAKIDQLERKKKRGFYLLMSAGIVVMFGSFVAAMFYSYGPEGMSQFQDITTWGVMIGVIIAVVQYLDRKLIRKKPLLGIA